jgi:hypothetical protein
MPVLLVSGKAYQQNDEVPGTAALARDWVSGVLYGGNGHFYGSRGLAAQFVRT